MSKSYEYVDLSEKDEKILRSWEWFEQVTSDPSAAARETQAAEEKSDQKPHMGAQRIIPGCIVKGVCSYVYLTGRKAENVSQSALYYALNGWHYLGDRENRGKASIYARNKDQFKCYEFYSKTFQPNFYQKYPKSKINIQEIKKALSNNIAEAYKCYLNIAKSLCSDKDEGIGQSLPYRWEAHHILPMTCFYETFTEKQLEVIRQSEFDINHGRFIIFLPHLKEDCDYHLLPYHSGNHLEYNKLVNCLLKDEFCDKLDKLAEPDEPMPHTGIRHKLMEDFGALADLLFGFISHYIKKNEIIKLG
jgi:hypothetical protein